MPDFTSFRKQTIDGDAFAEHILKPDPVRAAAMGIEATTTLPMKTETETDGWQTLCRARGWVCRVCGLYPEHGNPLGYEDGLCPEHRLTSHAE